MTSRISLRTKAHDLKKDLFLFWQKHVDFAENERAGTMQQRFLRLKALRASSECLFRLEVYKSKNSFKRIL